MQQREIDFNPGKDKKVEIMSDENNSGSEPEDFQSAMERLREVAGELEAGQLPLEQAMENYRKGIELVSYCESKLEEAELLIEEVDDSTPDNPTFNSKSEPE